MTHAPISRGPGYLEEAERLAGRRLACRAELDAMLRAAADPAMSADFDRALFLAKFWQGATAILRRTGPAADEVAKLTAELARAVGEASEIAVRLLAAGSPDLAGEYAAKYRPADIPGMERLSALLSDLALLKAHELREEGR